MKLYRSVFARGMFAVAWATAVAGLAFAGEHGCTHCGCGAPGRKICRLVYEEKKVPVVCWGVAREDFSVPCPSKPGQKYKDSVCDECSTTPADCDTKTRARPFVWREWFPKGGAKVCTRKKLMKKTVTKTIPGYKWVVETVCDDCEPMCVSAVPAPGVTVPPPPAGLATVKYPRD
jgi:hypothetical protein